jgi:hypothetical protein
VSHNVIPSRDSLEPLSIKTRAVPSDNVEAIIHRGNAMPLSKTKERQGLAAESPTATLVALPRQQGLSVREMSPFLSPPPEAIGLALLSFSPIQDGSRFLILPLIAWQCLGRMPACHDANAKHNSLPG